MFRFIYRTSTKSTIFVHNQTTAYTVAPYQKINATWIIILNKSNAFKSFIRTIEQ